MSKITTSLSLSRDLLSEIDRVASSRGLSRSALVAVAVADHLSGPISRDSFRRLLTLSEFSQTVLDVLLDENAPERRADVLKVVQERMEAFHAAG